jgi:hypothetical protein
MRPFRIYPCLSRADHDRVRPITRTACIFFDSQPVSQPAQQQQPRAKRTRRICQNTDLHVCTAQSSKCTRNSDTTTQLQLPAVKPIVRVQR